MAKISEKLILAIFFYTKPKPSSNFAFRGKTSVPSPPLATNSKKQIIGTDKSNTIQMCRFEKNFIMSNVWVRHNIK